MFEPMFYTFVTYVCVYKVKQQNKKHKKGSGPGSAENPRFLGKVAVRTLPPDPPRGRGDKNKIKSVLKIQMGSRSAALLGSSSPEFSRAL